MMGGAMSVLSNAVSTMSPTVVSAAPITDVGNNAVYSRGGEFAQALAIYRAHGYVRAAQRLAQLRRRARHRPSARELTPREAEIARLAVAGRSNRAIADELHIGERTVETHIAALFDRFDLSSRGQLATLIGDDARPVS